MRRYLWIVGAAALLLACGGSPAAPTQRPAGSTPGAVATQQPAAQTPAVNPPPGQVTPGAPAPNGGDNKTKARALIPPGATQVNEVVIGNSYTVHVSSNQTLDQLAAYWTQAIPAAGLQESGRFTAAETLTIAFTNPDGGIVASADPSTGFVLATISVGNS